MIESILKIIQDNLTKFQDLSRTDSQVFIENEIIKIKAKIEQSLNQNNPQKFTPDQPSNNADDANSDVDIISLLQQNKENPNEQENWHTHSVRPEGYYLDNTLTYTNNDLEGTLGLKDFDPLIDVLGAKSLD